jgi:hypothetical protein
VKATRARLIYTLFWIVVLLYVMIQSEIEDEAKFLLFFLIEGMAFPISFVVMFTVAANAKFAMWLVDNGIFVPNVVGFIHTQTSFKVQFFAWWLILFALSYWQWFYLAPRILRQREAMKP